jgi:choice-of-anchor B domain-containing protein
VGGLTGSKGESTRPIGTTQNFTGSGMTLLSQLTPAQLGDSGGNDCWGYTAPSNREYAIIGLGASSAWVEITDPTAPVIVATFSGPSSTWRDVKVFEDHAYVVTEGSGEAVQVFDMSNIDSGVVVKSNVLTSGPGGSSSHNIVINEASGYLYRVGSSGGDLLVYDLNSSKTNPPYVGAWNGAYIHDAQVHTYTTGPAAGKEVVFACVGGSGFRTVDVTNKASMTQMDSVTWSQLSYSHQGWIDKDEQYFYLNDELDESNFGINTKTIVIDVADPSNISLASTFDNGNPAIGHNGYVTAGDLLFEANYTSGVRVFDLSSNPLNPPEVAWYDTWPSDDAPTFDGLWSVYPYFPSGVIIGSDISAGLFVWWLGNPLVTITLAVTPPGILTPSGQTLPVTITEDSPGDLQTGTETLHYNDGGGWMSTSLASLGGTSYQAQFPSLTCGTSVSYYFSAESTNGLTWRDPSGGQGAPYNALVATSETIFFQDDFETNTGWVATNQGATTGDWDRGVPVDDPGWSYDPTADSDGSGQCWLTENAFGNTDVDDGAVRLRSPDLDLTGTNVTVQYDYYLNLSDASGIDKLKVEANDQAGSGWVEIVSHTTSGGTAWRTHALTASDFTSNGVSLTSNARLRFEANDSDPQSIVEAGLDAFVVKSLECNPISNYCTPGTTASGCQVNLTSTGTPSLSMATGFNIVGGSAEGAKDGIFFFAQNGQQANPWGNGTSFQCVTPPVRRTAIQSGGGTLNNCDGQFALDFNAFINANPAKAPTTTSPTQLQLWFRDPFSSSNQTTSLSNALQFTMNP